jgi:hypothetical protein
MSEQKTIEEKLKDTLSGELLINALDFVAYLRSIGMTPGEGETRFYYMGQFACIIIYDSDWWMVCDCPTKEHKSFPIDESVKEYAWASVKQCDKCGGADGCGHEDMGAAKEIFGKRYENLCSSECHFFDPNGDDLVKLKKLMELWTHIIADKQRAE